MYVSLAGFMLAMHIAAPAARAAQSAIAVALTMPFIGRVFLFIIMFPSYLNLK